VLNNVTSDNIHRPGIIGNHNAASNGFHSDRIKQCCVEGGMAFLLDFKTSKSVAVVCGSGDGICQIREFGKGKFFPSSSLWQRRWEFAF